MEQSELQKDVIRLLARASNLLQAGTFALTSTGASEFVSVQHHLDQLVAGLNENRLTVVENTLEVEVEEGEES